jgi:hypothetical protein
MKLRVSEDRNMARRRHKRSSSGGSCTPQQISFTTRRGKNVSFRGRPGGMTTAGGECKPKHRPTRHLAPFKTAFRKAVRTCASRSHVRRGKHGASPFNTCVGQHVARVG